MSRLLYTTAAITMIGLAVGSAHARAANYHHHAPWTQALAYPGYAGPVPSSYDEHYTMRYYGGPKSPMWPAVIGK